MAQVQRKQLIVDPAFQIRFILKFCIGVILISLLVGGFVYFLTRGSTTVAIENTKVLIKPTADFILPALSLTVLIVSIFAGLVVLILVLFISHRIAGPAFRLQREIDCMRKGDMNRDFHIRDKDQLQSLAHSLNMLISTFRTKHITLKESCHALEQYLKEKDFCITKEDKDELCKYVDQINGELTYFKVQ